jgi:6-phosphofructokinase 1
MIPSLGEARFASPAQRAVSDLARVPARVVHQLGEVPAEGLSFELAGPRARLYFDPAKVRAGIVTCGGLCPGLNNVIRSAFLELYHHYGVAEVLGFRHGYQGLDPARGAEPIVLTCDLVDDIHRVGGTILGTSRGPVDVANAVENLIQRKINILLVIGGDGTQRGGYKIFQEAQRRGYDLAVVGVPKTVDNDIPYVSRSFGFLTSVEEASRVLDCAHTECHSVFNGISLVKLMGRDAGFIAAGATIANHDVNFTLIPEVPFRLEGENGFLAVLRRRIEKRAHALVVVAEGAGQDLLQVENAAKDASGNRKLNDIGVFLRQQIETYFREQNIPVTLRYIDPSYIIRSVPADAEDSVLCDRFARNAVHAAMAGKTGLVIGLHHDHYVHVPTELIVQEKKRIDPTGGTWNAVLAATGQPAIFA